MTGKDEEPTESSEEESEEKTDTDENEDPFKLVSRGKNINANELIDKAFIDIARVNEGGSVGELSLVDGKPRFCTVKALTRCHLVCLSRHDYEKAKDQTKKKRISNLVSFMKKIPLFYNLTRTYLGNKLCNKVEFMEVNKDHVLFKEGDKADRIYIIKSGEFLVTKKKESDKKKTENIQDILDDPQRA